MNWRTLSLLGIVIIISLGSLLYFSRRQTTRPQDERIDTLIVGTNAEYPPFSFIENNQIVGLDIDIIKEIAQRLNKKITFKNMSFAALVPELQLGSIHAIAAGVTPSEEKAKRVFFTAVYFDGDPLMAVQYKSEPAISNADGLKGKIVSVNQGYTADQYLSGLDEFEAIRLSSPLVATGILTLESNQAQVYVASKTALKPYFEKQKKQMFKTTPLEGTEETYAIAVSKKYPDLYTAIQSTITNMIQDGTLKKLKEKWGLV